MTEKHDDNEERMRKILRGLPRVKAKPDFEQRLARRVAEGRGYRSSLFGWLNIAGRIPVPVYSAAALIILATVSYYAFFRSGTLPTPPPGKNEPALEPKVKDELSAARKENDQSQNKEASSADQKRKDAFREESAPSAPAAQIRRDNAASTAQRQPPPESSQERALTQQTAEGVAKSRLTSEEKAAVMQESSKLSEAPPNAPTTNIAPGQKSFAPQAQIQSMKASPYAVTAETFNAVSDSARRRDSLRADSLRKSKLDSLKQK